MRIKWIRKYTGDNLPTIEAKTSSKTLPEITTKSTLLLIPICILFALCVYCKHRFLGGLAFSRRDWMIGIVLALLFTPVHELLHALCFPRKSEVLMFYTAQGLGVTSIEPLTRNRFIVVNLVPSLLLGFVPLVLFMAIPHTYESASTILCVFSLVHLGCGYVDYLNIIHLIKVPSTAIIQISGEKILWYEQAEAQIDD